jgi:hypothetical protein
MKSLRFPVKGVGEFNLILSDIGVVVAIVSSAIVLFIGVSKYRVSLGQGFEVSVYRGIKVSECAVEILARSLVRQHFC